MLQTTTTPNFGAGNLSGSFALGSTEDVTGGGVIDGGTRISSPTARLFWQSMETEHSSRFFMWLRSSRGRLEMSA
jgi:hypothetical protein